MGEPIEFQIRRIDLRDAADDVLRALHSVEAPVAAEQGSNRMPQSVDAYKAFARNLPSRYDDHTWLVETPDGTPVAVGYCWSDAAGDRRRMYCDVLVSRARRRHGLGKSLLVVICEQTIAEGRSLLTWETFDTVPAGDAFSRSVGGRAGRVNRKSELRLADLDWELVAKWARGEPARERGYSLELVQGAFPERLRPDAVELHRIMQTAPRDNLEGGDAVVDTAFVAEMDRALVESGQTRWTVLVRDPAGACVGGTEVVFDPADSRTVHQQSTGIHAEHRRMGLARWAKAEMLEWIRQERPNVERVQTGNAFSNKTMLAINDALGFEVVSVQTDWQADVEDVYRTIRKG